MKMQNPFQIRSVSIEIVGENVSPWVSLSFEKHCVSLQLNKKYRDSLAMIYASSFMLGAVYDVT
jgi:hypothetical protein